LATNITDIAFDETLTIKLKRVLANSSVLDLDKIDFQAYGVVVEYNDGTDDVRVFFPYSAIESIYQVI
jgi:hypothetical protein